MRARGQRRVRGSEGWRFKARRHKVAAAVVSAAAEVASEYYAGVGG